MREGWEIRKVGEICDVSAGQGAPQGDDKYSITGTPFVKAGDLSGLVQGQMERDILHVSADVIKSYRLKEYPPGSVLFAKSGMSCMKGYVYTLRQSCCVVSHLAILIPKKAKSSYLQYCLRHIKPNTLVKDPAYPSISLADISSLHIPVPPVQEQEKIVAELDCLTGVIEKKKQQLENLDSLAQSIFSNMFGDPLTNPMMWERRDFKDVADFKNGANFSKTSSGKFSIKFLGVADFGENTKIEGKQLGSIIVNEQISEELFLKDDDIVFVRSNGSKSMVGRNVLVKTNNEVISYSGFCIRARLNSRILNPLYLNRLLITPSIRATITSSGQGCNISNLNQKNLGKLSIILPPLDLQNQFAQKIEAIERQKELVKRSIVETETLFNSRMDYWFN